MKPHRTRGPGSAVQHPIRTPWASSPARHVKRAFDIGLSVAALVALSPLLACVALAIRVTMGSPILFRQVRAGLDGVPFELVKFRTMRAPSEVPVGLPVGAARQRDDLDRLTRVGRFVRRTSLDELPQLWNILRGEMSLVGPRPLFMEYLPVFSCDEARRHDVPPGLTGWAQVHGRRSIPMRDRFAFDVWYVDHWSLWLDFRILLMTAASVITRPGDEGGAVVDPFFDVFLPDALPDRPEDHD